MERARVRWPGGKLESQQIRTAPAIHDLTANAEVFWRVRPFPDDRYGPVTLSGEPAPVARLGGFWLHRWTGMPIIVNRR